MVELMVSLVIGSLLMLGVFEIFISSNQNNRYAQSYARVQENGRLAMDILTRNLRMAGYQGCIDPDIIDLNIVADAPPTDDLTADGIFGYESDAGNWTIGAGANDRNPDLNAIVNVPNGTDIVYIQYVSPTGVQVYCSGTGKTCDVNNANVKIENNSIGLGQDDIVVISDCENADMFQITNSPTQDAASKTNLTHANSNNSPTAFSMSSSNLLSKNYDENAQVFFYRALAYYVADTGRDNERGDSIIALYQFDSLSQTSSELVEGVEQLQFQYGQRLSDGNLRFVPADDANIDFEEVEAVRLSILVSSSDPIMPEDDNDTYQLGDVQVAPAGTVGAETTHPIDRRLRQEFSTTLYMRNLG